MGNLQKNLTARPQDAHYSFGEEIANAVTHGIGATLAVAGLAILTYFAGRNGDIWHVTSCAVFGGTLVLLYTVSTLYHSLPQPRAKTVMKLLDHSAIFLLIAGTYTPFTLVSLRGPWGWTLFGIVWGIALVGIGFESSLLRGWTIISLALYIAMGWTIAIAFKPLLDNVETGGLVLLLLGGLAYTLGSVFYIWRQLPYHHAIWHIFVLAGSVLHFFAVFFYVIPAA
jgi:hemolysin III